jgi:hypothetical protein
VAKSHHSIKKRKKELERKFKQQQKIQRKHNKEPIESNGTMESVQEKDEN